MSSDERRSTEVRDYTKRTRLDATGEARAHAELLRRLAEEDEISREATAARKAFAARMRGVRARLRELRDALETGELVETARVYERPNPEGGVVEYVRADGTGEVFDTREMTPREKQGAFSW